MKTYILTGLLIALLLPNMALASTNDLSMALAETEVLLDEVLLIYENPTLEGLDNLSNHIANFSAQLEDMNLDMHTKNMMRNTFSSILQIINLVQELSS